MNYSRSARSDRPRNPGTSYPQNLTGKKSDPEVDADGGEAEEEKEAEEFFHQDMEELEIPG